MRTLGAVLCGFLISQTTINTDGCPPGSIVFRTSGTCPPGWTEVTALNGKMILGTVATNGDVGGTGGSDTVTPAGSVAAPVFTGNSVTSSAVSAGTPAGTNAAITAGTPAGTISALTTGADSSTTGGVAKAIAQTPTFTGSALGTHNHTFTGSAMGTHTHATTATGTNSAPAFTGTPFDTHPTYVRCIACMKQ
jgi:hypothetical protein